MKHLLLISLFIFSFQSLMAQRPRFDKMSPFVRDAMLSVSTVQSGMKTRYPQKEDDRVLTAFVRINGDSKLILQQYGCKELARVGNISIAAIPLRRLGELSCSNQVSKIETGKRCSVQMDTTRMVINAAPVNLGEGLSRAYTGQGVVVGVQDIGFDLTHPNFYSTDMSRYRIKALWDQLSRDTVGSSLYVGRDYVGQNALLQIGHPIDGLTQTHGTHTAGIAAGSGAEGGGIVSPYKGIAYDADLVLVDNLAGDNAALVDSTDYYKYTYATDALGFKYIFDYADQHHQPCVINFSEGGHEDFHGYDQLYYELLSSLTGPGHIIVSSAGNDAGYVNYIHKPIGQERAGSFLLGNQKRASFMCKGNKPFTFLITIYNKVGSPTVVSLPTSDVCSASDSLFRDTIRVEDKEFQVRVLAYSDSYNRKETAYDLSISSASGLGKDPLVSLQLVGKDADVELYRMSGYLISNAVDPTLNAGDNSHSILSPSSAPSVICVGATGYRTSFLNYLGEKKVYNNGEHGQRTPFSGVGPTFDGRIKPDVMAPGQNIISSYSSFFISNPANAGRPLSSDTRHFKYNGRTYAWNANAGTSMSAPVVTGAIALWLQADPALTPADCLEIFAKTCTHYDTSLTYPNNFYGYGQIDVAAGLREVLRRKATGIDDIAVQKSMVDDRIYLLDGRYVGTSMDNLPKGVYIRNGKKVIK